MKKLIDIKPQLNLSQEFPMVSADGKDYFSLKEIDFSDKEEFIILLNAIVNQMIRKGAIQKHQFREEGDSKLFIHFKSASNNSIENSMSRQKLLFKSLTEKEKVVLYFIGTGSKSCDTAFVLKISSHTLRQHLKSVYLKMGFHNRVQMAIWCYNFF